MESLAHSRCSTILAHVSVSQAAQALFLDLYNDVCGLLPWGGGRQRDLGSNPKSTASPILSLQRSATHFPRLLVESVKSANLQSHHRGEWKCVLEAPGQSVLVAIDSNLLESKDCTFLILVHPGWQSDRHTVGPAHSGPSAGLSFSGLPRNKNRAAQRPTWPGHRHPHKTLPVYTNVTF